MNDLLQMKTQKPNQPTILRILIHTSGMVSGTRDDSNSHTVNGHRLSTAVPASVTGDTITELSGMDLATKLHYLTLVYYFRPSEKMEGLTIEILKEPMFLTLDHFRQVAGRIRRNEASGRPHIKCNDSGVRFIEAECERLIDEWLIETKGFGSGRELLVSDKPHGPELQFSPLFMIQITRFKCGGLAVGISWAHVLGDAVAASNCINLWGQFVNGSQAPKKSHHTPNSINKTVFLPATGDPLSLKQVEPVGDLWLPHNKHAMVTSSFQITKTKLKHLQSKISGHIPAFEAIAALIWQILEKVRVGKDIHTVTIIRNDCSEERNQSLGNKQIISTVANDSSLAKFEISELAHLITEKRKDERKVIEEMVDKDNGKSDFIIYGANLTFIDMEGVDLYGLDLKGQKPVDMEFSIHGVGDEGAVLVLQKPGEARDDSGKVVTVILPEYEIPKLKEVLGSEWDIA